MENGSLEGLVTDNHKDGLFRVNRRAFTDPYVLELERERIFDQCWVYAGHESGVKARALFRVE